ncbi:nucleotidyltransferase domain-containing protein [Candidatus Dependentiae bacterium]|nr:nucleotidyltransferase domain-containing protein [Candidatus Dependentiae bacterium]
MIDPQVQQTIISIVHKHLPRCRIFLFGSRARGNHSQGADYDIALNNIEKISDTALVAIRGDINESNIYVFVDVVDINSVSDDFLKIAKKDFVEWTKN